MSRFPHRDKCVCVEGPVRPAAFVQHRWVRHRIQFTAVVVEACSAPLEKRVALPRDAWLEMHGRAGTQWIPVSHISCNGRVAQLHVHSRWQPPGVWTPTVHGHRQRQWRWRPRRRRAARSRGARPQLPPCSCRCQAPRQCPPCACRRVSTSGPTSCVSALLTSMGHQCIADARATSALLWTANTPGGRLCTAEYPVGEPIVYVFLAGALRCDLLRCRATHAPPGATSVGRTLDAR